MLMFNFKVIDAIFEKMNNDEPLTTEEEEILDAYAEALGGARFVGE